MDPSQLDPQTAALMQQGANVMPPQGPPGGPFGALPPSAAGVPGAQGLDPALVQQILMLQKQGGQQERVKRQLALADQLRAQGPNMSKSQSSIATPNYMGAIAQALAGYRANQLDKQAQAGMDAMAQQRMQAYSDYMRSLGGAPQPQPTPPPAAMGAAPNPFDTGG